MELSITEKIKLKTQQILMKTDDYFRNTGENRWSGMPATMDGLLFSATASVVGMLGVATIVASPDMPILASVAAFAAKPALTVAGVTINNAGLTLIAGGYYGINFSAFAKLYRQIRGDLKEHVSGRLDCVVKENGELKEVSVDRKTVLKAVEDGTFYQHYTAIRTYQNMGYEDIKIPLQDSLEKIAALPYFHGSKQVIPQRVEEDVKIVRRECFKEAKDANSAHKIMNRINGIREKVEKFGSMTRLRMD